MTKQTVLFGILGLALICSGGVANAGTIAPQPVSAKVSNSQLGVRLDNGSLHFKGHIQFNHQGLKKTGIDIRFSVRGTRLTTAVGATLRIHTVRPVGNGYMASAVLTMGGVSQQVKVPLRVVPNRPAQLARR